MNWPRSRGTWPIVILAVSGGLLAYQFVSDGDAVAARTPTHIVHRGEFRRSHFESGEIRATRSEPIQAPRVRSRLKIIDLWPEGELVEAGDLVVRFDRSEASQWLADEAAELEKARVERRSAIASQQQRITDLEIQIERSRASVELARINVRKAEVAPRIDKERSQISLRQSERSLVEATTGLEAARIVNEVEVAKLDLRIRQTEERYENARKDYDKLSVYAKGPGIVVYKVIRKGGQLREKVRKGDVVWGGRALLTLPDLSEMQVDSQIGEMDAQDVRVGQNALIRLEAFPGTVFHGEIASLSPMAAERHDAPNVKIIDMTVAIDEPDERLYPGMSASVEVILERLPNVLLVPLTALRETEAGCDVYRADGSSFKPVRVVVGSRNDVMGVIESGLRESDTVALHFEGLVQ